MSATRTETDTFGPIEVASDRYWGAQAQRSLGNFKIGWEKQPASIIRALGIIKRAAAETNRELAGRSTQPWQIVFRNSLSCHGPPECGPSR